MVNREADEKERDENVLRAMNEASQITRFYEWQLCTYVYFRRLIIITLEEIDEGTQKEDQWQNFAWKSSCFLLREGTDGAVLGEGG